MSTHQDKYKRAPRWSALFVVSLFVFILPVQAKECPPDKIDETVTVEKVIDGDTIKLKDGRMIRLIGINTPEMAHKGRPSEPFAKEAKLALKLLLEAAGPGDAKVGLQYDAERKDRYGRTLAHVFLSDGRSIEADLLSKGLGAQIIVPPNTKNQDCYREAEVEARKKQEGVWSSIYQPIPVETLSRDTKGFRVITGRVINVNESRKSFWVNFPRHADESPREGVAVRIARKDEAYFNKLQPAKLKNKKIIVRGWLYPYQKQLVMQVRHPLSIEIVPEAWNK